MQNQNETSSGGGAITSRSEMAGQNVGFADPVIREEAIGSLGVGPILADQWNTLPHGAPHLSQQFAEPFAKPRILKFAPSGFSINPMFGSACRIGSSSH
jgi:hypothetical protein